MGGKIWLFIEILTAALMVLLIILKFGFDYFTPKPKRSLKGKVVILTNCSHPLVASLAKQLAIKHRCHIACVDADQNVLNNLVTDINNIDETLLVGNFVWSGAEEDADDLNETISRYYKKIDILIAGEGLRRPKLKNPKNIQETIDYINEDLYSHFKLPLAFLPGMLVRDEGHMVTLSSITEERKAQQVVNKRPLRGRNGEITETLFDDLYRQNYKVRHTRVQAVSDRYLNMKSDDSIDKVAAEIIDGIQRNKRQVRTPGLKVRVKSYIASGLRAVSQLTISDSAL